MIKLMLNFEYEKTTKNTVRYKEVDSNSGDDRPVIGTLYIQQRTLGPVPPDTVDVTVEYTSTEIN